MKLIIDVNNDEYSKIKEWPNDVTSYPITLHIYDAIRHGIPLPKGHGRLIDADEIPIDCDYYDIENAPTLIGADKSESEE